MAIEMEKIDVLKSALRSSSEKTDIASKIKNIKGKIRMPIRNMTFVQPLNDVIKTSLNPNGDIGGSSVESYLNRSNASSLTTKNQTGSFADVVQSLERRGTSSRFDNTLYGYFIGPKLAFPLVENYVKNTWAKFGLKRIQLQEEFFLFQFDTKEGMESVMENGPWSTYARILIKISAKKELLESMVIAIPLSNGKGHSLATVDIEYEWKPPRCSTCAIFDHGPEKCPKNPTVEVAPKEKDDGFVEVTRKKHKAKQNSKAKHIDGLRLNKPSVNFYYRKVEKGETSKVNRPDSNLVSKGVSNEGFVNAGKKSSNDKSSPKPYDGVVGNEKVELKNSFSTLGEGETDWEDDGDKIMVINDSDSEAIDEELVMEEPRATNASANDITGASTPSVDVRHIISENNLSICAILESHVADSNLLKLCPLIFRHWNWTSNGSCCLKGTRIILGWNHNDVDIVVINQDDQIIHIRVWLKLERKELFCSFVYAHNRYIQRRELWKSLCIHKHYVRDRPWCILGDFNAALFLHDSSAGNSNVDISMREFKDCIEEIEVMDVQHSGLQFTWSQKPKGRDGILKKIDRIMANLAFNDNFAGAHAMFKPYRISDHAPSILIIPTLTKPKPKPFKFYNIITCKDNFAQVVKEGWSRQVSGFHMFRVAQRLKSLKKPLRKLLYDKGNLHTNVNLLRDQLDRVQMRLDMDPFNEAIREEEANTVVAFNEACLLEERFLKQKAKINWLKEGDSNSAFFHKSVKSRISRSRIDVVTNSDGMVFENENAASAFVSHYEAFLGQSGTTCGLNDNDLFHVILDQNVAIDMIRNVTRQEVKNALFSMGNDKAPGPDGYMAAFFKVSWDIVADDFVAAVCEFFTNGKILKELNHTIIALIPKNSRKGTLPNPLIAEYERRNKRNTITYSLQLVSNANLKWRDLPSVERHAYCEKLEMMKLEYIYKGDGGIFVDYSWERELSIANEIYLEWVLEFFSTLYFDKDVDRNNLMKEKCIWFRLCGHEHILTLPEFAVVLGLFTEDEVKHHLFEVYFGRLEVDDKKFDHKDYWTIVGKPTLTNHKEVLVNEPLMRIVHKVIMGSLAHRVASRKRCQKRDLWMMSALEESPGVNLAWIIADHLYKHALGTKENSVICVGHYVTKIACFLGYCVDDDDMDE
ncbi:RNA-directed DNA polymerase, eukaryota, reverse transcriptase zinc-binding domain protein [Tanacetum coccineum]